MRILARLVYLQVFLLLFLFLFSQISQSKIFAEGEFQTDYKVDYSVNDTGKTTAVEKITLKNKTSNYYADKFELKIGSTQVTEVKAEDEVGPMKTEVKFDNNVTTISVKFNQRVIGEGKSTPWTLTYASSELATKSGQIWEISIPRLAKSSDIGNYEAQLKVPNSFGSNAFAYPTPSATSKQGLNQAFTFTKDQVTAAGISMSFGEKQVFEYTLNYYLENKNLTNQTQEITLPPDNNYQKVVFLSIEPPPLDVTVDKEGNFLAKYHLSPKQSANITLKGYVEVFSKPFRNIDNKLTEDQKKQYLLPQQYWEVDASTIKDKARDLKSPKEIYDFVTNYLTYSDAKLKQKEIARLGAVAAYQNPKEAVCMEFTDLFITLARATGIPAREVIGYAYTQNTRLRPLSLATQGDLLHAWPEYWDDKLGWVQIDPTWASTSGGLDYFNKLDFNHITLAQRGLSSIEPFPAGSFKKEENSDEKDVNVSFAQSLPEITSTPQLELETPDKIISGVPTNVTAKIKNIGSTSILPNQLLLEAKVLQINSKNPQRVDVMPPFSQRKIDYKLQSKSLLTKVNDRLVLTFADTQISKPVLIIPFYYLALSPQFLIVLSASTLIIIAGLLLYNRIYKHKKIKLPPHLE